MVLSSAVWHHFLTLPLVVPALALLGVLGATNEVQRRRKIYFRRASFHINHDSGVKTARFIR
jgi:hypothetical protein